MSIFRTTPAEKIAEDTWDIIKMSWDLDTRLGEETLTDLLTLQFAYLNPGLVRLLQITKNRESKQGADLDIRIYAGGNKAFVFAVQAKKLYPSKRYDTLKTKGKPPYKYQIDVLEEYSKQENAIPLYLLYNCVNPQKLQPYWHCGKYPNEKQLGCTIAPSWTVRWAINGRGCRNFESIHESGRGALPWRCLFDCPRRSDLQELSTALGILSTSHDSLPQPNEQEWIPDYNWIRFKPVDGAWPEWLWRRDSATLSANEWTKERGSKESRMDRPIPEMLPRHILLVKEMPQGHMHGCDIGRVDY